MVNKEKNYMKKLIVMMLVLSGQGHEIVRSGRRQFGHY